MTFPVAIVGASCTFPSGPTLPLADSALRAQVMLLRHHPFYGDRCGMRVRASYFPELTGAFDAGRWCQLAKEALDALAANLLGQPSLKGRKCLLWLVVPSPTRPGVPADLIERLRQVVEDDRFNWHQIMAIRGGHAVGAHAMKQAALATAQSEALAIVLSVDSWLHPESLQWLEEKRLLHGARHVFEGRACANPYGRVPGEGAAALAVCGEGKVDTWTHILGAATAIEPIERGASQASLGQGLTQAAYEAMESTNSHNALGISTVYTDMNGEPDRADEFGFLSLRLADSLGPQWKRVTPALAAGDLGTCGSIAHVALAAYRLRRKPDASSTLVLASSDDERRGAVILGTPGARTLRGRTR